MQSFKAAAFHSLVISLLIVFSLHSLKSFSSASTLPEKVLFQRLSPADNMAVNSVIAISQDQQGFIWFGAGGGLNRYDGYELTHVPIFGKGNDIPQQSSIYVLYRGRDGMIWVGRENLTRYDPVTERAKVYPVTESKGVRVITEDDQGLLWFGGERLGLRCFDPSRESLVATHFHNRAFPQRTDSINDLLIQDNHIWVASDEGLFVFDRETNQFSSAVQHDLLEQVVVSSLVGDSLGRVWIGTWKGLLRYDPQTGVLNDFRLLAGREPTAQSMHTNQVHSLHCDSVGNIWIGTDKQGVAVFDFMTQSFRHYPAGIHDPYRLGGGAVHNIFEDKDHGIWFAVQGFGLYRFDPNNQLFRYFAPNPDNENMLNYPTVLSIVEGGDEEIWIATDGGGLNLLKNYRHGDMTFSSYRHERGNPDSIRSDSVIGLAREDNGTLWIGSWGGGLSRFDPQTGYYRHWHKECHSGDQGCLNVLPQTQVSRHSPTLASDNVFKLYIDRLHRLWISVWGVGLQVMDLETQQVLTTLAGDPAAGKSSMHNNNVMAILEDRDGMIWIGGYNGLDRYDPETGTFINYSVADRPFNGLNHNTIFDIYQSRQGQLWVATENGLHLFDPQSGTFTLFAREHGLPASSIVGILEDGDHCLWLSTSYGLIRFNPSTGEVRNYFKEEGLQSNEFSRFSRAALRSGELVFGGVNGFNLFDPARVGADKKPPVVALTDLLLFNHPVRVGDDGGRLQQSVHQAKRIYLQPDDDTISLRFSALEFGTPDSVQYRYRMDGVDGEWLETGSKQRMATYTQLSPRDYRFRVQAKFENSSWGPEASVVLAVAPHWWETIAFRLALLVLVLLAIAYVTSLHFRRFRAIFTAEQEHKEALLLKEKNSHLARLNNELEELAQEKETLLRVMVHDLCNPLSIIQLSLHRLDRHAETLSVEEIKDKTTDLSGTVNRLISIIYNTISPRDDSAAPDPEISGDRTAHIDIKKHLSNRLKEHQLHADEKGIRLRLDYDLPDGVMVRADSTRFSRIMDNLLSNGLKFSWPDSDLIVRCYRLDGMACVVVQDQGPGLSDEDKRNIFGKGARLSARPTAGEPSHGLGLFAARRMAKQIGAELSVASDGPGQGATFVLRLQTFAP